MAHLLQLVSTTHCHPQSVELMLQAITKGFIGSRWKNLAVAQPPEVFLAFLMDNSDCSMVNTNSMTQTQKLTATQYLVTTKAPAAFKFIQVHEQVIAHCPGSLVIKQMEGGNISLLA